MNQTSDHRNGGYLEAIRRGKFLVLQAVIVVTLCVFLLTSRETPLYRATAQVILTYQNLAAGVTGTADSVGVLQTPDRIAETQVILARVPVILQRAITAAHVPNRTAEELQATSTVAVESNADVLDFQVTDTNPTAAARLATAYARQYTIYKQHVDTASVANARAEVENRIRRLRRSGQVRGALYSDLVRREQQLATLESLQTSNAFVIRAPSRATKIRPKPLRNTILGVVAGLLIGVGLAYIWGRLDRRVRSVDEIEDVLSVPLLARLPGRRRRTVGTGRLTTLDAPNGPLAESFRVLRTSLELANVGMRARTLLITSAMNGEGKSTVAANLAVTFARAGNRVVLVDLDLRRPTLGTLFELHAPLGVTDVASGRATLLEALIRVPVSSADAAPKGGSNRNGQGTIAGLLELLLPGRRPPNLGEFVGSQALADVLADLREQADYVLIDAPPMVGPAHDAMVLSTHVDAVLAVARLGVISRPMLQEFRRLLENAPAEKLGFVVIGAGLSGVSAYDGRYYAGAESEALRDPTPERT